MMPGMDGWAVLTALKADPDTADIPVVMLTIVDDKKHGLRARRRGLLHQADRLAAADLRCSRSTGDQAGTDRVLVVEDDASTRELLPRNLRRTTGRSRRPRTAGSALERLAEARPR